MISESYARKFCCDDISLIENYDLASECGRIYAIAKGKTTYLPVGKSPLEIFKLVK